MAAVHSVMGGSTCFFPLLLLLQNVNSINISIVGSRQYAQLNQSLRMTCTVPESELQRGSIVFRRNESSIICSRTVKTCARFADSLGYNCSCGANGVFNLTILKVRVRDKGVWSCVRASSSSLYLNVYYGPFKNVTVDKDSPLTVTEDKNVSLTARCSADCNPKCNYTWTKGSVQVSHKRDLPVSGFNRTQMGNYTCTARNPTTGDTADSQTLTVDVQWRPASPTTNCPSWIVDKTSNCTCQTKDIGNPAGTVEWIDARNQTVTSSGSSTVQLNLTSIERSDEEMNFICRANNSLPNSNSDITYVARTAYMDGPNITLDKQDVNENDSVTVTCIVVSNPTVEMTIDHINSNKTLVAADSNNITHTIKSVQCPHNGIFRCTTKNSQTDTVNNNTAHLNVTCSPRQDPKKSLKSVVSGKLMTFASLTANVIANPLPTFTWYNHSSSRTQVTSSPDRMIVSNGLSSTLKICIKGEGDYANYSVVVANNFGKTSLFFRLRYDPPMPMVQSFNIIPIVVGVGAAVLVTMIIVVIVIRHKRDVLKCTGNSNKKDRPTQQDERAHAIDNEYMEGDDGLKYGRDEDGLMYVGVEFGNQATPAAAPEWTDEATEYAGIAHGIVGSPLPADKEDEKK